MNPQFFIDLFKQIEEFEGKRIIVGDFNTVLETSVDRTSQSGQNNEGATLAIK